MKRDPGSRSLRRLVGWLALAMIAAPQAFAAPPRLVVQITIDQLRGDVPGRFASRFGKDGFRHFFDEGMHFRNAHYRHSATFTAVGHATLFTGASPSLHGLAGNDWFDRETGKRVYCVEDERHTLIGRNHEPHEGTSPRNLLVDTIGDELVLATRGKSRAFSVSIKDRGAIVPGGHLGKAFWYDGGAGQFVTSTYYFDAYPKWVSDWNASRPARRYHEAGWTLLRDRASYDARDRDDRPYENPPEALGRVFPHQLGNVDLETFERLLRITPMGDALTVDFAIELIDREGLGQRDTTDFLAVSLSATDYIGHIFGPASLEAEDNVLRLDRTLARLLRHIDEKIGLDQVLVVLSSDHGVDEAPEFKASLGFPAGRHDAPAFVEAANAHLREVFGVDEDLVVTFLNPSLYLDSKALERNGLAPSAVERELAAYVRRQEGFSLALTRTDLLTGNVPLSKLAKQMQNSFHPTRSGNVIVAQSPSWFLFQKKAPYAGMHGSPHTYDTYVPILIAGPGIAKGVVNRPVAPRDIAPTIALHLGIKPPSGSTGKPLAEALSD